MPILDNVSLFSPIKDGLRDRRYQRLAIRLGVLESLHAKGGGRRGPAPAATA